MTPARRDLVALVVKSPWWVVVALVSSGAVWADRAEAKFDALQAVVEDGRSQPQIQFQRDLDSLRIETRHLSQSVSDLVEGQAELRHLVLRLGAVRRYSPTIATPLQPAPSEAPK